MSQFLLDTCTISDPMTKLPNPGVTAFYGEIMPLDAFICTTSLGEIVKGIELMAAGTRRHRLETWFADELLVHFGGRILVFDLAVAQAWGKLVARLEKIARPMPVMDSLIAATALVYGLTVVTRDEADYANSGVKILNPWK